MTVKYLIIRFSSIGDIVLTTPLIRCLKQQVEGAEIHFLTKMQYENILASNPYIDKLHLFDGNLWETGRRLVDERFDYVIDLHRNIRSFRIKNTLRVLSFSFKKLNYKKYMAVRFKKLHLLPQIHIVDRYMETLKLFDVENDKAGLEFFIPDEEELLQDDFPENFRGKFLVMVVGAKHETKRIPEHIIAEIANACELPVVLAGGPDDEIIASSIKAMLKVPGWNTCGKLSLGGSASLVRDASVVITSDTGLMHIAAAFKKPVISLWGNTIPEFGMTPYLAGEGSRIFEVKNLKCRPCSKLGHPKCPKKHFHCMEKQDVNEIIRHIRSLI